MSIFTLRMYTSGGRNEMVIGMMIIMIALIFFLSPFLRVYISCDNKYYVGYGMQL